MFGFVAARCRSRDAKATAVKGGTEGGLMYPNNSVVTVLFCSQAAAITSNLLLFLETRNPPV